TAFAGPACAFWRPLQALNFLRPAPPGPVAASPGPAPPAGGLCRPTLASSLGLSRARSLLLPATGLLRPSPAHASGRAPQAQDLTSVRPRQVQPPASRRPVQAQPLSLNGLSTPSSRLTAASPGQSSSCLSAAPPRPAPVSQWPR
ncbi:PREDICTED: putative uncharacterized protein FLJ46235, partial [Cercocebus atys]|uniref:putative uncharacterized protein FLJ46235 n=1 Tax=Cercocebus atys TaxID=9531 RepID=UPI0005F44BB7